MTAAVLDDEAHRRFVERLLECSLACADSVVELERLAETVRKTLADADATGRDAEEILERARRAVDDLRLHRDRVEGVTAALMASLGGNTDELSEAYRRMACGVRERVNQAVERVSLLIELRRLERDCQRLCRPHSLREREALAGELRDFLADAEIAITRASYAGDADLEARFLALIGRAS